jgi:hypothetical protein
MKCSKLRVMNINSSQRLSGNALHIIALYLSRTLRKIDISYCDHVDMLVELKHCTLLEKINISYTRNNPEDRLDELFTSCKLLREIRMNNTVVNDAALYAIAHHCPHIEKIFMCYSTGYTPAGVIELVKHTK